jgi:hypothetical protein
MNKHGLLRKVNFLLLGSVITIANADVASAQSTEAHDRWALSQSSTYGHLPLHFEANRGQVDSTVRFLARGTGYDLFLTPTETVLSVRTHQAPQERRTTNAIPSRTENAVVRMRLIGANTRRPTSPPAVARPQ